SWLPRGTWALTLNAKSAWRSRSRRAIFLPFVRDSSGIVQSGLEPGLGIGPPGIGGARGNAQMGCRPRNRQAGEIAELDQLGHRRFRGFQPGEGLIQGK